MNLVAFGGMACMTHVEVSGEKKIRAAIRERLHSQPRATNQIGFIMSFRQIERVVCDHDLGYLVSKNTKFIAHPFDLESIDASSFNCQRSGRADSNDSNLVIKIKRPQVVGDKTSILVERLQKAREWIVQWHIVIAGNDDLRMRQ